MSLEAVRLGRKRPVPACPNPLFLQWLTEMRDHAKEKGLKTQYVYQKAINSLKKYPLPLKNGKEAKILQNFGDGICKILDERLQKHYQKNGVSAPIHNLPAVTKPSSNNLPSTTLSAHCSGNLLARAEGNTRKFEAITCQEKQRKKKREYVPQKRSGGYAVLLTLYRHSQITGNKGYMFKNELQSEAQLLCDKSFTVPDVGSKYTAWSSVSTLIQKNLLQKSHNPARYSLTELGVALAKKLDSVEKVIQDDQEEVKKSEAEESEEGPVTIDLTEDDEVDEHEGEDSCVQREGYNASASATHAAPASGLSEMHCDLKTEKTAYLLPGSYEIILCIDFIETTGGNTARKQELVKVLQKNRVTFDIRKLNVGDFLWVAREKVTPVPGQLRPPVAKELVLDYIIERKRMDDLCSSIIDGRFREQKFRLKRCGLHNPIYLVEGCGSAAAHLSLPESTLQQAIVNTQIVDGFFVKKVRDLKETAAYLTIMTRQLQRLYENRTLFCHSRELEGDKDVLMGGNKNRENPRCSLIPFTEFNYGAMKNKCQTVREVFARQLMQISGISGDKAAAILEHYSTLNSLLTAYAKCSSEAEKETLLSSIKYGKLKRNIGPVLSRTLYQLYCTEGPLS